LSKSEIRTATMPRIWARLQSIGRSDWVVEFPASYASGSKPITIGRNPTSTLCLTDNMTVSNRHITLEQRVSEQDGRRIVIMHESSSNGTLVNGVQYQKGQSVELTPGAEISFPCEDTMRNDKKSDFTFVFQVLAEEVEEGFVGNSAEGNPLEDKKKNKSQPSEEWLKLQEQCDALAREAGRLAASVYVNSDKIHELAVVLTQPSNNNDGDSGPIYKDPLEEAARDMLLLLKVAEEKLKSLGDEETVQKIDSQKWEITLSKLGITTTDVQLSSNNSGNTLRKQ
jgi:pSer/pThr/pTyr-binding forkhead associated (FHA) protein